MRIKALRKFLKGRKAQVGLGTLIIFIAMILVAAVAAGTLMRTSGSLEFKARTTGEMATKEVSTNLKVIEIAGYAGDGGTLQNNITKLIITISLAPGSSDIAYEDIIMSYHANDTYIRGIRYDSTIADSENSTTADNDVADFGIVALNTVTDDTNLERNEIVELHFWIEDSAGDHPLKSNGEFFITLMPVGSTPLEYGRIVPSAIKSLYIRRWA
jgi:flagellin-like protein